jgi:hypothetical protein
MRFDPGAVFLKHKFQVCGCLQFRQERLAFIVAQRDMPYFSQEPSGKFRFPHRDCQTSAEDQRL